MSTLDKRFLPLYISTFFSGLVFWYSIEKLFMSQIGFSDSTIMLAMALMIVCIFIFEMPSGFLADRWSRRGVIAIAHISLGLSSFVGYLSHSPLPFLICAALWGVYYAMNSGVVESIVYDTLLEERGNRHGFEKYFGKTRALLSISLVIGAANGGLVSALFEPRIAFLITIPSAIFGLIAISFFHEPSLHKTETEISTQQHLKNAAKIFISTKTLVHVAISIMLVTTVCRFMSEFQQLWFISLGLGVAYFGLVHALMNTSFGIAGYFTHVAQKYGITDYMLIIGATISIIGLSVQSLPVVIASVFLSVVLLSMANVILTGKMHDQIPSSQRSGISSTVSTISSLLFLVTTLLSSYLVHFSLYLLVPLLIILLLFGGLYARKTMPQTLILDTNQ